MGRPTKQGIDYFPVDVQFDEKVELFIAESENGAEALGILLTIWQIIYKNNGYYVKNDNDLVLLIRRRLMSSKNVIEMVIESAIEREIFDKSLAKRYRILSSKAIQTRYFVAARKKKEVSVVKNYIHKCVSVGENTIYIGVDSAGNATKEKEEEKEDTGKITADFNDFYKHYPKKVNKTAAQKAWKKLKPDAELLEKMLSSLAIQKESKDWTKENGQFIPYPSTWLNNHRWEDEQEKEESEWI